MKDIMKQRLALIGAFVLVALSIALLFKLVITPSQNPATVYVDTNKQILKIDNLILREGGNATSVKFVYTNF
jgi:hypothetical protein